MTREEIMFFQKALEEIQKDYALEYMANKSDSKKALQLKRKYCNIKKMLDILNKE